MNMDYGITCSIFFSFIFSVSAIVSNNTLDIFRHLSARPSFRLDVFSQSVVIKCPLSSNKSPTKPTVRWKFNERDLVSGNGISISEGNLTIKSFDAQKHNGIYSCVLSVDQLVFRGPDIWVQKKSGPTFTIKKQTVSLSGNAVFTCYDNPKWNKDQFRVQWFKENQPVKKSSHVRAWDQLLFIKNVSSENVGLYHCEISTIDGSFKQKSEKQPLSIVTDSIEYPTIQFVTKVGEVLEGENFTLFCASRENADVVHLYQHNERHSYLISQQNGYVHQVIKAKRSSTYSCEVESNRIRAREDIKVRVISLPHITNPKSVVINELVTLKDLKLECEVNESDPPSKISWYKDGTKIEKQHLNWLEISQMKAKNTGLYQCIASNNAGSTMKLFYLSLGITGLTPRDLKVNIASPIFVDVYWKEPSAVDVNKTHHYAGTVTNAKGDSQHFTSTKTSVEVRLDGDTEYFLMVCFSYKPEIPSTDCAYDNFVMPEGGHAVGPVLKSIKRSDELVYKIEWEHVLHESKLEEIIYYTVNVVPFFGGMEGDLKKYYQMDPALNSLTIELKHEGSYKVWVTAVTANGESRKQNELVLNTNDIGPESNPSLINVKWSTMNKNEAVVSWKPAKLNHIQVSRLDFKLYYISIPYKHYWKEVKTLETNRSSITIPNLNSSSVYRFTVVHIITKRQITPRQRRIESQTSNAYLVPPSMVLTRKKTPSENVVPAPSSPRCVNKYFTEKIYLMWDPIPDRYNISGYKINVFNEVDGIVSVYETTRSTILLEKLNKGYWYGIQVHGFGKTDVIFEKTEFLSCKTTTRAPSQPRDVHYSFVFDKSMDTAYLRLKWKPPVYTGTGVYQYEIQRISNQLTKPGFPFSEYIEHLVMEPMSDNDDEYLHCEAVWTDQSKSHPLQQKFKITPMSDQGLGESYVNKTHAVFFSIRHKTNQPPASVLESDEIDNRIGILVGVCVSIAFMGIFIVICAVKEPCRKVPKHILGSSGSSDDSYLYHQKLLEVRTSNSRSTSEESGESSIQKKKKKCTRWKFLRMLNRNSKRLNNQYEGTNYSDSGIRVSYSSGSSGRRAHECNPARCPPNCTTSCLVLESASDSSSERRTTFSTGSN